MIWGDQRGNEASRARKQLSAILELGVWKTALNLSRINYLECFAKIANQS